LRFDPDNPLTLEFLFDLQGRDNIDKADSDRLIRYFLAGLTIPEDKLWVNLSPLDKDRVIPDVLNSTDLGNDLVRQDYMLKQLGCALSYPETRLGEEYWTAIRKAMVKQTGNELATDAFSKLWIVPESAAVYEQGNVVLITGAKLKTMLEQDYRLMNNMGADPDTNNVVTGIARDKILPVVDKDVNISKSFGRLRQIYYSLILAQWFKEKLKESFYKEYIDKEKISGVNGADPTAREKMFRRYVESFQNGVYNYTRTEFENYETIHRQYYSGGIQPAAGLVIGKKIRMSTDSEAAKIFKTPLLGIMAGLSFVRKSRQVIVVGLIGASAFSGDAGAIELGRVNIDAPKTAPAGGGEYGGIDLNKTTPVRLGNASCFNLRDVEVGDFDGLAFAELSRRRVRAGDLINP
jgi:hypothetical protein